MKFKFSKDWCEMMARRERGFDVNAGLLSGQVENDDIATDLADSEDNKSFALMKFIQLSRRNRGLTLKQLADKADVEVTEIIGIEADIHFKPEPRTLYQLSELFNVSQMKLMEISGLTTTKDVNYVDEAVRYAASSDSISKLTPEEQAALDGLVSVLGKTK